MSARKHILCYVDDHKAWFTNRPLSKQRGDDWDDAPYQSNAGDPYQDEPGQLVALYFDGPFDTPGYKPYLSVDQINQGAAAWVIPQTQAGRMILAGCPIDEFIAAIEEGGGTIYVPRNLPAEGATE